jgi:hypothetical protein
MTSTSIPRALNQRARQKPSGRYLKGHSNTAYLAACLLGFLLPALEELGYQILMTRHCFLSKPTRDFEAYLKGILLNPTRTQSGFLEERQMKVAISIGVAVVLPFGFLVLAGIVVNHVLAKRRQLRRAQFQMPSVSIQDNGTRQPPAPPLCNVELQRAAA